MHNASVRNAKKFDRGTRSRKKVIATELLESDAEREDVKSSVALQNARIAVKEKAEEIARKVTEGKDLDRADIKTIATVPATRIYYLQALEAAGHGTQRYISMFDALHEIASCPWSKDSDRIKAANAYIARRNEISGLEKSKADRDTSPTKIVIEFPEAFAQDGNAKVEIGIRASPGTTPPDPCPPVREVHNSDMRDQEWQDPSGDIHSPVLGDETGEAG